MTTANLNAGEVFAGTITPAHAEPYHLIVLPHHANEIDWHTAKTWAIERNASLPNEHEHQLIEQNCPCRVSKGWYWTASHGDVRAYAIQHKSTCQNSSATPSLLIDKTSRENAIAVRRVPVKSARDVQ